jgi:hypothetical protein
MLMQVMMYVVDGQFIHLDLVEENDQTKKKNIYTMYMNLILAKRRLKMKKLFISEKKDIKILVKIAIVDVCISVLAIVPIVQALHVVARHVVQSQVVHLELPPSTPQEH